MRPRGGPTEHATSRPVAWVDPRPLTAYYVDGELVGEYRMPPEKLAEHLRWQIEHGLIAPDRHRVLRCGGTTMEV